MTSYKFFVGQYNTWIIICIKKITDEYKEYLDCLTFAEKKEYEKIKSEKRQKEYILGHFAGKKAVQILLDEQKKMDEISINHGMFGQPIVDCGCNIQVSLSHSSDYVVAVAFDEKYPCAVDVETIRKENREAIKHYLTLNEQKMVNSNRISDYTVIWTAKEALSKILRTGLTTELSIYEVEQLEVNSRQSNGLYKYFKQYKFISKEIESNIVTLALPKKFDIGLWKEDILMDFSKKNTNCIVKTLRMQLREIINYTYIVIDGKTNEAIIIDPSWEIEKIIETVSEEKAVVKGVLLTHYHYDHTNLVDEVVEIYDCPVYMSLSEINYYNFSCKNMEPLFDMGIIKLGNSDILCIETPGHTKGSMCFLVDDTFFTGDTLFMEGVGLCDMKGGDAYEMYESIKKIKRYVLPSTRVYPGHAYFLAVGEKYEEVFNNNIYLQIEEKEKFVEFRNRKNRNSVQYI